MKPDRNAPCNCGSGKKFKHCCERKNVSNTRMPSSIEIDPLIVLFNTDRYAELETQVRTLLAQYPNAGILWQFLGGSLQMQGKDALHAFQKTVELLPEDAQAHFNLGVVQKGLNQLDEAAASYRCAIKLKPDFAEAQSNLDKVLQLIRYQTPLKELPQHVFIVGAQKAGTTALHSYLVQHPMIIAGLGKELGFFHKDAVYAEGIHKYRYGFPDSTSGTHALDATPEYMYHSKSAERIHSFRPNAKIIMLLREPVSRAFSAFNMYQQYSKQSFFRNILQTANADAKAFFMPLAEGLVEPEIRRFLDCEMKMIRGETEGEEPALIRRGIYAPQIERFVRLFGKENVLILFSQDLKQSPEAIVDQTFGFLGLEPLTQAQYPLKHVREYTADIAARHEISQCAGALFEKDKQDLRDIYGISVPW